MVNSEETENDDEDDDVDWDRAKTATRTRDGSVRWRAIWRAIRGRRSEHDDLIPWFVGFVVLVVLSVAAVVLDGGYSLVDSLMLTAFLLTVYGLILVRNLGRRLDEYHQADTDVESRLLADRYAAGDLDDEEFQRRIDLLVEEGPEAVQRVDAGSESGDDEGTADVDPLATLRESFAAGELDEDEYRARLETLRETASAGERGEADAVPDGPRGADLETNVETE